LRALIASTNSTRAALIQEVFVLQDGRSARIENDMGGEIDDFLELLRGDIKHEAHPRRDALQIPNMGAGRNELNVAKALASPLFRDDLDTALFAGDALVTDLLVFAAMAFVVFGRTEDLFAEETSHLRLLGAIVDGLRFGDLAMAPAADGVRGSKTHLHRG
jgi:hypothetical protein